MVCGGPYLPNKTYHTPTNPSDPRRRAPRARILMRRGVPEPIALRMGKAPDSAWQPLDATDISSHEAEYEKEMALRQYSCWLPRRGGRRGMLRLGNIVAFVNGYIIRILDFCERRGAWL
ncbi:hypothetical protein TWF696_004648 [Orbilia brochopaga]|uniref:Uncharacterized protein n=1 Tax=Orbilia brochopaga TaxID=3140254 RepID=A0AAV9V7Y2_9PEZI